MRKSIISILLLLFHFSVQAETPGQDKSKQIDEAKIAIVKATVEFLATDKETFKEVKEPVCGNCKSYSELLAFVKKNKIIKADDLINEWKKVKVDTTGNWKNSLISFKKQVNNKIIIGKKVKRKNIPTYAAYVKKIDSIVEKVSIDETVEVAEITTVPSDSLDEPDETEQSGDTPETPVVTSGYLSMLPDISKDLYYVIMFVLLAGFIFLFGIFNAKSKALARKEEELKQLSRKADSDAWQNKSVENELKSALQKLKISEEANVSLQDNLKLESDRNKRLSVVAEVEKPIVQTVITTQAPVIKYARYADQGDGFSTQELLEEEDSETIFEQLITSSNSATFKISSNQSAQKYALSNSPYFLGKTSQYDTFPSTNSLIYTDAPGELKLQGNKWLIVKPAQIRFS